MSQARLSPGPRTLSRPGRSFVAAAAVLPLLLILAQGTGLAAPKGEDALARLWANDDPAACLEQARSLAASASPKHLAAFGAAYLALEAGGGSGAEEAIEQFVACDKETSDGLLLLAGLADRGARASEAEALYRRALETDPKNPRAYLSLARFLGRQPEGDPRREESLGLLREGTGRCFDSPALHLAWADRLLEGGDEKKARKEIREAELAGCETAELQACLGRLYGRLGEGAREEEHWRRSRGLSLKYGPAAGGLAGVLARTGRTVEAIELLHQAGRTLDRPQWQAAVHRDLGYAFLGLDETECARRCLEEARRLDPAIDIADGLAALDRAREAPDAASRQALLLQVAAEALPGWDFGEREDIRRAVRHLADTAAR